MNKTFTKVGKSSSLSPFLGELPSDLRIQSTNCMLVVEDHQDTATALITWLKTCGLRAVHASNSSEALQILDDILFLGAQFAGVLVDYRLPDGTGYRIAERFLDQAPGTPVALMSAYPDLDLQIWSKAHGVTIFPKPLKTSLLRLWLKESTDAACAMRQ